MLVAFMVAVSAWQLKPEEIVYYANGSNNFDLRVSFYIAVITTLVAVEYWNDLWLRAISGTIALFAINNFLEELLFNPLTFDLGEKTLFAFLSIHLLFTLRALWKRRHLTKTT